MSSDLPVGQQSKEPDLQTRLRLVLGPHSWADIGPIFAAEVARVRAQVAEELAGLVGSLCPAQVDHAGVHCDYAVAAAAIREHAGKGLPGHAAALPDVVGTPDHSEARDAD